MDATSPRILVVRPPEVPRYFNAGHHLPVFAAGAYLRRHADGATVDTLDAGALNVTWKELCDRLWTGGYDIIACMNDLGEVGAVGELVEHARALCPNARLVTFGRLSSLLPHYFERYDLDGVVSSGDYEAGLVTFLRWTANSSEPRRGVAVRVGGSWLPEEGPGRLLPAEDWVLPDVGEIPHDAYDRLYQREENRFCGLPGKRELVVPVARGCPVRCGFCEVWRREGLRERRLSVQRVIAYIDRCLARARFDYVAMYSPTFTLQRRWVWELCDALEASGLGIPWKCTTTLHHLDEELLTRMAAAGCTRVSVGIETLEPDAQALLPAAKQTDERRFDALGERCARLGLELNCFVILGLPGATVEGTLATVRHIRDRGARVRPAFYADYGRMRPDMDDRAISRFDHQVAPAGLDSQEAASLRRLFHAPDGPEW